MIRKIIKINETLCNGCGGLPYAVKTAIENSGKDIALNIVTIAPNGTVTP